MARSFNTTGPCIPENHFMLPTEPRIPEARELIEKELYFALHAPRQSGKTTCFYALAQALNDEGKYAAVYASCERGNVANSDLESGIQAVLRTIELQSEKLPEALRPQALEPFLSMEPESRLRTWLTRWCQNSERPVALFLDEIDSLTGNTLLSVLRQLREGYLDRPARFPSSVVLIGMRDVRDYRARVRPDIETLGSASPFNIKAESLTLESFTESEIAVLYGQHTEDTGQAFTEGAVTRAFEMTRGQPWLTNALAKQIVSKLVPDRAASIEAHHVERATEILIARRDTHLDSLIERLREDRSEISEALHQGRRIRLLRL